MAQETEWTPNSREWRLRQRRLLRQAARGDGETYASLAAPYVNLITEYLVLGGIEEDPERRKKACDVLREMWKFLPFMRRTADFEHLLATTLFSVSSYERPPARLPLPNALLGLNPREKFAFLAREFENWDYAGTAAALRLSRRELGESLVSVRCRLLNFDLTDLDKPDAECIRRLSLDLDEQYGPREKKKICQQVRALPRAREFKSEWLDLRCQLIEFRQQIRLPEEEKTSLLREAVTGLQSEQMIRIPLFERLVGRVVSRPTPVNLL